MAAGTHTVLTEIAGFTDDTWTLEQTATALSYYKGFDVPVFDTDDWTLLNRAVQSGDAQWVREVAGALAVLYSHLKGLTYEQIMARHNEYVRYGSPGDRVRANAWQCARGNVLI